MSSRKDGGSFRFLVGSTGFHLQVTHAARSEGDSAFQNSYDGDAMLTRIVGTAVANAGSAVDALAKVPGMMTRNGELQVIGKGTPIYYVNGRKVTDLTELQRISSHEIKDVEVISTPGARYDAQTSAVVRIRTLRKQGDGFGITLDTRDAKALSCTNNQWNSNLRVNYHHRSLDVFGGFTYDQNYLGRYATRVTQNTFYKQRSDEAGNAVEIICRLPIVRMALPT